MGANDQAGLTTEIVLKRTIPWDAYENASLIPNAGVQLLQKYDRASESQKASFLDEDGPSYVQVFLTILRTVNKTETVEYVIALIDEMLTANPMRARLLYDQSLSGEDIYEPFLRLLSSGNWFIQEKTCKILSQLVSVRSSGHSGTIKNGESSKLKSKLTAVADVQKSLIEWICIQFKSPTHPNLSVPVAMNALTTMLRDPRARILFVQTDGIKLLVPLINPASSQQSIQLLYETCLCVWLLSYYDAAVDYLVTTKVTSKLVEVVKGSTKEKVVRVVMLTFCNLLSKGAFAAQMIDFGLPQIVQNMKTQAWTDQDLLDALNQLEEGLAASIKRLSSFEKYKQQVVLGHLDWSPMHKDSYFWRENINNFEENDFQILRVLLTILETSSDPTALAVGCYDLSQFIQYHPVGRIILTDLKGKDVVMKLMNHDNDEVRKNALLCVQRLFLGAKYASFLQS